jgi:parallel beta-helix repeat protein
MNDDHDSNGTPADNGDHGSNGRDDDLAPNGSNGTPADNAPGNGSNGRGHNWSSAALAEDDARRVQQLLLARRLPRPRRKRRAPDGGDAPVAAARRPGVAFFAAAGMLALTLSAFAVGLSVRTTMNGDGDSTSTARETDASVAAPPVTVPVIVEKLPPGTPKVCKLPDERTEGTDEIYTGSDINRQLLPYSPFRVIQYPCSNISANVRATLLYRDAIVLLQGGRITRAIPFDATKPVTFRQISDAIRNRDWIAEVSAGVFQIHSALIQLEGTSLEIAAPDVKELRLVNRPHAFLGGRGATATINGVRVTSWDPQRGGPDRDPIDGRPFILYEKGSRLDIIKSEIMFLGSDRSGGAYGTAWRTGGTTGSAIDSTFSNNWIGVYTLEARDIVFRGNKFIDNDLYGLDPHDYSYRLTVERNIASGNESHGLIFSRGVVDSVMRDNVVFDNGGNGIVLDLGSDRNIIENNLVENNKKDGIVLIGSGSSRIVNNTVRGNRTGIRLNNPGARDVDIENNLVEGNGTGIHIYGGAGDVRLTANEVRSTAGSAVIAEGATSVSKLEISDARTGIDTRSAIDLEQVRITGVDIGVAARSDGVIELRASELVAREVGIRLYPGTTSTQADDVSIDAPVLLKATDGHLRFRQVLPYFGAGALVAAVVLEFLRGSRTRGEWAHLAPAGVTNIR